MALIKYYLDPAADAEIEQRRTVGESLLARWPNGIAPAGLRIYRDSVAEPNNVTFDVPALTAVTDDTFIVVVEARELNTVLLVISIVIGVTSVLLNPGIPNALPNANRTQQSPNNFFGARRNEPRVNQRSADIRGRQPNAYPDLLQVPYRKFVNGVEYEYLYAQVTEGYAITDDWRDGDTLISRIDGVRLAVYGPDTSPISGAPELVIGDGAPEENLYIVYESNEVDGQVLRPPDSKSALTAQYDVYSDGRIATSDTGVDFTTVLAVGDDIQLLDFYAFEFDSSVQAYIRYALSGTYTVTNVQTQQFTVGVTTPWWGPNPSSPQSLISSAYQDNNNPAEWYLVDTPDTSFVTFIPTLQTDTEAPFVAGPVNTNSHDALWVNVVATNGCYVDDGTDIVPLSVGYKTTIYELDDNDSRTGQSVPVYGVVKGDTLNPRNAVGDTVKITNPYGKSEITVERTSLTSTREGSVVDEIKWRNLYLVDDVDTLDASYATTVHAQIKSTESALRVKERKLNCNVLRLVSEYLGNGIFANNESHPSDLFADVVASIWRDPRFGRGQDDEVNWEQLYSVQSYMLSYYGNDLDPIRVGYTFDSDKISAEEAIKLICNAVNVEPYRVGSVLNFWFESPQTESTMQFGHRFKHPGTDRRSRFFGIENDRTGVELTYYDEVTENYETLTRGSDINPLKIELSGCITARGAQIRIDREWNKLRYSRIQHQFDATAIGRMVVPGMRVDVIDNTRYAPYNGEIRAVDGLTLTISQPVSLTVPTDYSIVLTRSDGGIESRAITTQPAPNKLTIASAPSEAPYTGRDKDKTAYSIATDDGRTQMGMLVREINPKEYNRVTISCINYDDRYYSQDNVS